MVASAKLKFDTVTVRDNGKGGADGKGSTADFVSGLVSSRPSSTKSPKTPASNCPIFSASRSAGWGQPPEFTQ